MHDSANKQVLEKYIKSLRVWGYSVLSIRYVNTVLSKLLISTSKNIRELTKEDVYYWLNGNYGLKSTLSYDTVHLILSRFFTYCLKERIIFKVPLDQE